MKLPFLCLAATLALGASARADLDRSQPPAPAPAPTASFPDFQQTTLSDGLKVFVVENRRQPTVTFRLLIKSGDALDGDKPGVSDAVASLLEKGTPTRSAAEFARQIDFLGAGIGAASGSDALSVSASGLVRDLPKVLDLFTDAALRATFPADELVKYQRQTISGLIAQKQRPGALAAKLLGKLLYGAHPYGAYQTEASVSAITRDDLAAFHQRWFLPTNASLAIVGDVHAADVIPQLEKAFADWKTPADAPKPPDFPALPEPPKAVTIHLVDQPGSVQSSVTVAMRGVPRDNPDVPEIGVMNTILGGGFSGRLFQNLRERHGYTYGSSSGFAMNRLAGVFSASAEVRNEVTGPAIEEILAEIKRIRAEVPPAPELAMQRQYLAGNYLLSLESAERTAERVQEIDLYGLPANYFKNYVQRVSNVSAEAIKGFADKYLPVDAATVIVVGEAKDVKAPLAKLGPVIVYDLDLKAVTK